MHNTKQQRVPQTRPDCMKVFWKGPGYYRASTVTTKFGPVLYVVYVNTDTPTASMVYFNRRPPLVSTLVH